MKKREKLENSLENDFLADEKITESFGFEDF